VSGRWWVVGAQSQPVLIASMLCSGGRAAAEAAATNTTPLSFVVTIQASPVHNRTWSKISMCFNEDGGRYYEFVAPPSGGSDSVLVFGEADANATTSSGCAAHGIVSDCYRYSTSLLYTTTPLHRPPLHRPPLYRSHHYTTGTALTTPTTPTTHHTTGTTS
jgi:hypothetical protein